MTRYYHSSRLHCRPVSVSHHLFNIFRPTLLALVVLFLSSCEEEPTQIGSGLLPGSDFVSIKSTDTIRVWSYTKYDGAVRSDNPTFSYLGSIYDPYFGTSSAGFVSQIRLKPKWDGKPFAIDSVKLFLKILDVKGVNESIHVLRMSEISEQIYSDSVYYSDRPVPLTGFKIADIVLPVLKPDTVNYIEIKLPDTEFGEYLTRDTAKLFYNNNIPDFRSFFKGLYFELYSDTDPLLLTFNLIHDPSGYYSNYFILYLHDEHGNAKEYAFILDAKNINAAFNKFSHDFTSAVKGNINEVINKVSKPLVSDTLTYQQYLNGVYTSITLPGLETLKNDPAFNNIAVNRARLIVPVHFDGDLYKASTAPSRLYLRYRTKSGTKYIVPDWDIDMTYRNFFDGKIDTTNNVYKFNLAAFVQGYLEDSTGDILPEVELFQSTSETRNVILKANNSKKPVKFEFTYTKF